MKHLMTFESFQFINEGFFSDIFSKIASKLDTPELSKIKDQFNKDLPNLIKKVGDVDPKELTDIIQKTNKKLPEVVSNKLNEAVTKRLETKEGFDWREHDIDYRIAHSNINTTGGEEKEESKVFDIIFGILNVATGSSIFYLIWKVVLEWWLMHRGLIELELGFWGKVAIFMTLIGTICNGLYQNYLNRRARG